MIWISKQRSFPQELMLNFLLWQEYETLNQPYIIKYLPKIHHKIPTFLQNSTTIPELLPCHVIFGIRAIHINLVRESKQIHKIFSQTSRFPSLSPKKIYISSTKEKQKNWFNRSLFPCCKPLKNSKKKIEKNRLGHIIIPKPKPILFFKPQFTIPLSRFLVCRCRNPCAPLSLLLFSCQPRRNRALFPDYLLFVPLLRLSLSPSHLVPSSHQCKLENLSPVTSCHCLHTALRPKLILSLTSTSTALNSTFPHLPASNQDRPHIPAILSSSFSW